MNAQLSEHKKKIVSFLERLLLPFGNLYTFGAIIKSNVPSLRDEREIWSVKKVTEEQKFCFYRA